MSTDDRDIESSNPSKNFKVGDFDQRSGFFTPVWESKRRIRSEPPAPPSSKGSSGESAPESAGQAEEAPAATGKGKSAKGGTIPRPSSPASKGKGGRSAGPRLPTPVPPAPSSELPGSEQPLAADVAAVFNASVQLQPAAPLSELEAGAPAAGAAPAAPEPEASKRPSAAARALRDAGPDLPPAAFLDEEPEFRSPRAPAPRPARTASNYRSLRASSAAARVHDQLKAKLQAEAAEIDESRFDLDPDTHRGLQTAESSDPDPYPLSLLRRLRRTIRLSSPVPDPIRSLISKYDRG